MNYICPVYSTTTPFQTPEPITSNFFVEPATNLNHCSSKAVKAVNKFSDIQGCHCVQVFFKNTKHKSSEFKRKQKNIKASWIRRTINLRTLAVKSNNKPRQIIERDSSKIQPQLEDRKWFTFISNVLNHKLLLPCLLGSSHLI